MIKLTLLDRQEIALNCDLIAWIGARPDTTVRMVSGESLVVRETVDEVVQRIVAYRGKVLADSGLPALLSGASTALLSGSSLGRAQAFTPLLEVEP